MIRLLLLLFALMLGGAARAETVAIVGASLYRSPTAPRERADVVIADGKIAAIGAGVPIPAGARRIDAAGAFLTAGFWNCHVHFTEPKFADAAHQPAAALLASLAAMLTRWGFVTVVDTASFLENTVALRRRIDGGDVAGPRILTAGGALYPPDGIPYYVRDAVPKEVLPLLAQPRTAAKAKAIVEQQLASGGDLVKLFTGSWVTRGKVKLMPLDVATAAVRAAHGRKRLVFAHPSNVAGARVAIDAGVDVLAHAIEELRGYDPSLLRTMAARKMALVPTLALFAGDEQIDAIVNEVKEARALGVRILFGTDVGFRTEYSPAGDYAMLALAGFDGRALLAALTTAPAEEFGVAAHAGTLAVGHDADLVALDADPVEDVRALTRVRFTMRAGRVLWQAP